MKNETNQPGDEAELRRRAEEITREDEAQSPEQLAPLSPEAMRQTIHELRVHQIELEMQNEDLRRTQVELDATRARYFDLYDLAPVGYLTVSKQGLILEANLTSATLLGRARGALVRQLLSQFVLPEDQDILYLLRKQLFKTGNLQVCELRIGRPDGTVFWARLIATTAHDADASPVCRLVMSDITGRKRAEDRVREQAELLNQTSDAIYVRYMDDVIAVWNRGAEKMFGWPASEIVGRKSMETFVPQAMRGRAEVIDHQTLEHGHWFGELDFVSKTGAQIAGDVRVSLVNRSSSAPKSFLVLVTDITEKKQMESQFLRAQRMQCIGTLAGGVAHDLNNIFSPILMSLPLLRCPLDPADLNETLNLVESSTKRGALIVKQLLTYVRGLGGKKINIQLAHLVKDMDNIIRSTFPRNISVDFRRMQELWLVQGDPTQIHQILLNLCVNARDAMPQGGTLRMKMENRLLDEDFARGNPESKAGPYVCIRVSDTGTGILPEHIDKIFDPFFTTKEIGKGTGLGLATVLGIVKTHGGFIKVNSAVGQGTTFEVFLPATPEAADAVVLAETPNLSQGNGEIILVVDDEENIRAITGRILTRHGYRVLSAANGIEAKSLYDQNRATISLVLADYMMPNLDGLQLARALHRMNPEVRIILSSGVTEALTDGIIAEFKTYGVIEQIAKPYTADILLNMLYDILHPQQQAYKEREHE